jgi:hypothetical protein
MASADRAGELVASMTLRWTGARVRCSPATPTAALPRPIGAAVVGAGPRHRTGGRDPAGRLLRPGPPAPPAASATPGRRWIVYVGDGLASAGHRRTGALAAEAAAIARRAGAAITAVGIGGDADAAALAAIARAGGGFHVPWVPGQKSAVAARSVLETTYGVSLRDAKVELPAGLADAAPTVLPTIRAGDEVWAGASPANAMTWSDRHRRPPVRQPLPGEAGGTTAAATPVPGWRR